ncbi:hypothetical protein [Psychrobacter sp. LV10R520-6]|uniref:hypothetical protein n=1 Tax=Psychrobacter sp. LV10R520-6 TaxID=1415574 RepID=UPI0024C6C6AA|nr:hypothetical protein [Psychrobacter sp. LV10R520-6]SNT70103.1 hypothetical protein SAMN04488491_1241 [Psychrobacter sp. LV10R520-6]
MTNNNPYNFLPLKPTGRNETDTANTYSPEDMIKIYEQQFLTQVPDEKLKEFPSVLKGFYDIDDNTLDICAVVFDAVSDSCIIYNHKVKVGDYEILGGLVKEELAEDEIYKDSEGYEDKEVQAYTLECKRTFFINEIELPYHFNLFIHGDGYSTLTKRETLLEKIYWFVSDGFEENVLGDSEDKESLTSINEQLASSSIQEMDMTTVHEIVDYVEDSIIDDEMVEALNKLLDDAE